MHMCTICAQNFEQKSWKIFLFGCTIHTCFIQGLTMFNSNVDSCRTLKEMPIEGPLLITYPFCFSMPVLNYRVAGTCHSSILMVVWQACCNTLLCSLVRHFIVFKNPCLVTSYVGLELVNRFKPACLRVRVCWYRLGWAVASVAWVWSRQFRSVRFSSDDVEILIRANVLAVQ